MLDRASTFANPEVVQFVKSKVVPVAIDQAYQRRQQDTEGEFYRKIVSQSPRRDFGNKTTQGLYVASADGTFLGFTNHRSPERVMGMLTAALDEHGDTVVAPIEGRTFDERWNPRLPEGGLVVRVRARVLDGYDAPETRFQQIFQTALSRDNLWITGQEKRELVSGKVPPVLVTRIARFHLVDNTRGEPPMWRQNEIVSKELLIDGNTLKGHFELKTPSGDRSYSVDLRGRIEKNEETITQLDMVALGTFEGEGRYTRGAPERPFPLAISFTLADGSDIADSVLPQASRGWVDGYLKPR